MARLRHSTYLFVQALLLSLLVGCEAVPVNWASDPLGDYDGDGALNFEDCAWKDPLVQGDADGDGYFDEGCWTDAPDYHPPNDEDKENGEMDCDDSNPYIHPAGGRTGTMDETDEFWVYREVARGHPESTMSEFCDQEDGVWVVPGWAGDGLDNDCDRKTDVGDYDGDLVSRLEWARRQGQDLDADVFDCDDCRATVHPGIDERDTVTDTDSEGTEIECPIYAYDGIDNDCNGGDVYDFDRDGFPGGWHPESACGRVNNATQEEEEPYHRTDDFPVTNAELIDAAPWANGALDCDDLDIGKHPAAMERCDQQDWNCSFPRTGVWDERHSEDYTVDGFIPLDDGGYELFVAPDGGGSGISSFAPTTLEAAGETLALCPVINMKGGIYTTSLDLSITPADPDAEEEEPTDTGLADTGLQDTDMQDTDSPNAATPREPLNVVFRSVEDEVIWRGAGGPALSLWQLQQDSLTVTGLQFEGGDEGEGGLVVGGGGLTVQETRFDGIIASAFAALDHNGGRETALIDVHFVGTTRSGLGCASAISQSFTLSGGIFQRCNSVLDGGALFVTVGARDDEEDEDQEEEADTPTHIVDIDRLEIVDSDSRSQGGGASLTGDRITLRDATVINAHAGSDGGGLMLDADQLELTNLVLVGNSAEGFGGGLYVTATQPPTEDEENHALSIQDLLLASNTAERSGGGAFLSSVGDANLDNVLLGSTTSTGDWNRSSGSGGGVWIDTSGDLSVNGLYTQSTSVDTMLEQTVQVYGGGGVAARNGGSLYALGAAAVTLSDVFLACEPPREATEHALRGGGAYVVHTSQDDPLTLADLSITSCESVEAGGGVAVASIGQVELDGVNELQTNSTLGYGGGLTLRATRLATAESSTLTLTDNDAGGDGGGLWLSVDSAQLSGLTATGNSAGDEGGAMWMRVKAESDMDLPESQQESDDAFQGADTAPWSTLEEAIFEENTSASNGGALYLTGGGAVEVSESWFFENSATGGSGGGLYGVTLQRLILDTCEFEGTSNTTHAGSEQEDSSYAGGGAAIAVVGEVVIYDTHFLDLWANGPGGGLSLANIADARIGTYEALDESWEDPPAAFQATGSSDGGSMNVTITDCVAASVGGGMSMRSIDELRLDSVLLNGNDGGSQGVQAHLNRVNGWLNYLNIYDGGGRGCSFCDGIDAYYQTHGYIDFTNSRIHDNDTMGGWGLKLSQNAWMSARNVLVHNNSNGTNSDDNPENDPDYDRNGGVYVKNSSTLIGQSLTVAGNHGQGIRISEPGTIALGCSLIRNNEGVGIRKPTDNNRLFCVMSKRNSQNIVLGDSTSDKPENKVCGSSGCSVDTIPQQSQYPAWNDSSSSWPVVLSITDRDASSTSYQACYGNLESSNELYPRSTGQDDEGQFVRRGLNAWCIGESSDFPFGYDEDAIIARWYTAASEE